MLEMSIYDTVEVALVLLAGKSGINIAYCSGKASVLSTQSFCFSVLYTAGY